MHLLCSPDLSNTWKWSLFQKVVKVLSWKPYCWHSGYLACWAPRLTSEPCAVLCWDPVGAPGLWLFLWRHPDLVGSGSGIWTVLSLIFSGSREVCAEKLMYSLVKGRMWGPTTNYTSIKQHWEFAGWPTLVFRCFCVIYFASVYVIMMQNCSGCAQYTKPPQGWKGILALTMWQLHLTSLGLDTLGTRKMGKWPKKKKKERDRKGSWHFVVGLMTPGSSLVDSLHFLEPTASADPECIGLARS